MKQLLFMFLLLSFGAARAEYSIEIDVSHHKLEHAWRGENNYAQFEKELQGIGLTIWNKNNFGLRVGYIDGKPLNTEGRFKIITLSLKYIASLELLYRYKLYKGLYFVGGISTSIIPIPNLASTDPHYSTDHDNDEGYILSLQYKVNKNFSVGWRYKQQSRIKSGKYDEWIRSHSFNLTYIF